LPLLHQNDPLSAVSSSLHSISLSLESSTGWTPIPRSFQDILEAADLQMMSSHRLRAKSLGLRLRSPGDPSNHPTDPSAHRPDFSFQVGSSVRRFQMYRAASSTIQNDALILAGKIIRIYVVCQKMMPSLPDALGSGIQDMEGAPQQGSLSLFSPPPVG
jgi:hypothetical protein